MTDERWSRVKALFQAAVERPTEERDAFLTTATGDDEALRREVDSLLTSDTSDASFLGQLPVATDGGGPGDHVCGRRLEALRPHWAALDGMRLRASASRQCRGAAQPPAHLHRSHLHGGLIRGSVAARAR